MKTLANQVAAVVLVAALASVLSAQWPNYPTAGVPRTTTGQPVLDGPTPKAADGHPDLSGIWSFPGFRLPGLRLMGLLLPGLRLPGFLLLALLLMGLRLLELRLLELLRAGLRRVDLRQGLDVAAGLRLPMLPPDRPPQRSSTLERARPCPCCPGRRIS
jgi:hypothetical protein